MSTAPRTLVAVVMGSKSDWEVMQHTTATLNELGIQHEVRVTSAHRTPDATFKYASELAERGVEAVIAAAGGAAHLAGVMAAKTALPVLGVPLVAGALNGLDALLATVQMPAGIPVATFAIGKPGAINAALFAAALLGNKHPEIAKAVQRFRQKQTETILAIGDPRNS
ncbi:MAG TPA: 5-(carboxyamino)imidazole ribonucleotide mutase [Polyangiaceae bacterium]|jgi:5-(carboxyamino)imidazole ribonucleotide mutase|nr:5-(carboxyamino)imidazole ribonucleotide mutase [Polyangiaceae bacterium]